MADKLEKPADEAAMNPAPKAAEPDVKVQEPATTADAPYPSQADLDRIKEGTFNKRNREVKAESSKADYKTR